MSKLRSLKDVAKADGLDAHEWLSCRAVAWLVMRGFRVAATEVPVGRETDDYDGKAELADACGVGIVQGWARCCVVEVKVSRSDFLADFKKEHRQADFGDGVTDRFYLLPKGLARPEEVPDPWGLAEWDPDTNRVSVAKRAKGRKLAQRPVGSPHVPNLAPPWAYELEDAVPGGRNAWVRSWWNVVARTVNAYEFGYLALQKNKNAGGYYFGTPTLAARLGESLLGKAPQTARRLSLPEDAERARAIAVRTWGEFVLAPGVEGPGEAYWERAMGRRERDETEMLVADTPRGVGGILELSCPEAGRPLEIVHLAVPSTVRRRGLGTQLLTEAIATAVRKEVPLRAWAWSTNKPALALYASLGFEEEDRRYRDRGAGVDSVLLRWEPGLG